MCNADVTLMTFEWIPNFEKPWANFNVEHQCVDWNTIFDWAMRRSITMTDLDRLLENPIYNSSLRKPPFSYLLRQRASTQKL